MNMNNSSFEEFILKKCICILKIIQLYQTEEKLKTGRVNRNVRKDYRPWILLKSMNQLIIFSIIFYGCTQCVFIAHYELQNTFFAEKILLLIKLECIISEILFPRERGKKKKKQKKLKTKKKLKGKIKAKVLQSLQVAQIS